MVSGHERRQIGRPLAWLLALAVLAASAVPRPLLAQGASNAVLAANQAFASGDVGTLESIASGTSPVPAEIAAQAGEVIEYRLSLARRLLEVDRAAAQRAFLALAAEVRRAEASREPWIVAQRLEIIEIFDVLADLQAERGELNEAAESATKAFEQTMIVHAPESDAFSYAAGRMNLARARAGLAEVDVAGATRRQRAAPGRAAYNLVEVHYATHRRPTGATVPGKFFGGETGPLQYGRAVVSVPTDREIGSLPKPSIWSLEFRTDPAKHVALTKVQPIDGREAFVRNVADRIRRSQHKESFVFVHGYNSSFEAAVERAAQIAADLHFDGAPIVYSWPSQGSLAGYLTDASTVEQAQLPRELADLLTDVARRTGARRVHLVAHSMGNRVMLAALQRLAASAKPPKFSEIVFAAPDVAQSDFSSAWSKIRPLGTRFTLYASRRDKALLLSQQINGEIRAGDASRMMLRPGLQSVDTSLASGGLLGHNDFAGTALEDFRAVLWLSLAPEKRCVLQATGQGASRYWVFGKGCSQDEFREATARVRAAGSAAAALKRIDAEMARAPSTRGVLTRVRERVLATFGGG